jgi:peroxiredoxin
MSDAAPPGSPAPPAAGAAPPDPEPIRPPRKRFILIGAGIGLLIVVLIGLFTSLGSGTGTGTGTSVCGSGGGQPQAGDPVPAFSAQNIGPVGPSQVSVKPSGSSRGAPVVLLFFGNWCASCHQELPPLAAAVRQQQQTGGPLARVRVLGVDSEDSTGDAKAFIKSADVHFPVAYDPNVTITEGDFFFHGDPYTVFVKGDGTISKVVAGAGLTPAAFVADERALIPSGT